MQVARLAEGVRRFDFDQGLAPYDLSRYGQWQALSSHITPAVVDALMPVSDTGIQRQVASLDAACGT